MYHEFTKLKKKWIERNKICFYFKSVKSIIQSVFFSVVNDLNLRDYLAINKLINNDDANFTLITKEKMGIFYRFLDFLFLNWEKLGPISSPKFRLGKSLTRELRKYLIFVRYVELKNRYPE